jgi:hypothetical protein
MAESAQIQKVGIKHEAILNFLVVNPLVPLSQVAREFGVTQPWLSTIIHSDAFQARLRERNEQVFHKSVLPLADKLLGLAHQAVEKIGDQLAVTTDPEHTLEVATRILDRIGHSPKTVQAAAVQNIQQNNFYQVDKATLEEARNAIGRRLGGTPVPLAIEGEVLPATASAE